MLDGQLADPMLADTLKGFVLLHIDLTKPPEGSPASKTADKYGVKYLPDLRILSADGTVKASVEARLAKDLVKELGDALKK